MGVLAKEQVRLFIGPGYLSHHILDSYLHPLIIYYSGDHVRKKENATWKHGIIENLLNGGLKFERAMFQTKQLVRILKCDPSGLKRLFFRSVDFFTKESASFS